MKEMMKEMVGGCCVCSDERGWPDNPLVYCDGNGCTVAVHQACYGIIAVPTGPWYCRKCESPETKGKVRCELCPSKSGALKRSDTGGWAHVVCALYIPEVRFGNVTSMEPIVLRLIPPERYNKTCYICQDLGKTHRANAGACMQCNKSGCKQQFHVTCAQSLGLLCEEAGNYLDNVKYCGYCQHHYSKLKKGGNVKTIPPYKPVSHDSRSDSSEREVEPPGAPHCKRGPGRKSSHSSGGASGKNTPNSAKTPTNSTQPMDKKKPSPSRRGSCAEGGSKTSTPAPSPQHVTEQKGCSTPISTAKIPLPPESPGKEGVISSVAAIAAIPIPPSTSTTTVVQTSKAYESVITNTEAVDNKQTKKRKAVTGAQAPVDYATSPVPVELSTPGGNSIWEQQPSHASNEPNLEVEKIIKKAKTEAIDSGSGGPFSSMSPAPPPPPPPAHSPAAHAAHPALQSPRHLASPMPGPSGLNQASNIRSPSQHQMKERDGPGPASLLVSVPLPSASHGLNLSAHAHAHAHAQIPLPSPMPEMGQIFHQVHKQAAMEPGLSHSPHARSWGGLNVSYELQDPGKPGVSGVAGTSKESLVGSNIANMPPAMRNKKRAAMATSMANTPPPPPMQTATAQNLTSMRRAPQPTPPPVYHEIIKDSPPSSPSSERPLKPKLEHNPGGGCSAPHMLGNELNPESGAAARLQEQLSAELAAHAAGAASAHEAPVPPPLINKAAPRSGAQSLDQLLERQWEQGSQFLMEQAQHFDTSLLSCLHQLRTENVRLEEHVGSLLQRRDHLLAVNARLAIPLAVVGGPGEPVRCPRENGTPVRAPPVAGRPADAVSCDRHQLMMREMQQKPS